MPEEMKDLLDLMVEMEEMDHLEKRWGLEITFGRMMS